MWLVTTLSIHLHQNTCSEHFLCRKLFSPNRPQNPCWKSLKNRADKVAWHLKIVHKLARIHDCQSFNFNHSQRKKFLPKTLANIHWKNRNDSINLWNTVRGGGERKLFLFLLCLELGFFRLSYLGVRLKYDKYVGLVKSEYWVHITRFIVTSWQAAQPNQTKPKQTKQI